MLSRKHLGSGYTLSYELSTSPTAPKEVFASIYGQAFSLVSNYSFNNPNDPLKKGSSIGAKNGAESL